VESSSVPVKKLFIVVIDDSETVCRLLEAILTGEGHQVRWFLDSVRALHSIQKGETPLPDVLIVDVNIPHLDGYGVVKRFKDNPASRHIPAIMISRWDDTISHLKARLVGAHAYLAKPFQPQDVIALIQPFTTLPNSNTPENK
jgi:twitching motility two-component system response regulator PilG